MTHEEKGKTLLSVVLVASLIPALSLHNTATEKREKFTLCTHEHNASHICVVHFILSAEGEHVMQTSRGQQSPLGAIECTYSNTNPTQADDP